MNPWIILLTVGADRLSKAWASRRLRYQQLVRTESAHLYFKRVNNYGFANGIMSKDPKFVRLVSALMLAAVLLASLAGRGGRGKMARTGLSLIFGGGLANLVDRYLDGYVTDFITFRESGGKIYNLADFAIFKGCILYALSEMGAQREVQRMKKGQKWMKWK